MFDAGVGIHGNGLQETQYGHGHKLVTHNINVSDIVE